MACILPASARAQRAAGKDDEDKPPFEVVELETRDGMQLRGFYFASGEGKSAVPVILVHEWEGQAARYRDLILNLQEAGCAVLAIDYRGHGGSKSVVDRRGKTTVLKTSRMSRAQLAMIVTADLEAAKGFLKEKNNAGELNLNALVMVGIGEGAIFGCQWAINDWSFPSIGSVKQGQDVKALVCVSPVRNIKGIAFAPLLRSAALVQLPMLFVDGKTSPTAAETNSAIKQLTQRKRMLPSDLAKVLESELAATSLSKASLIGEIKTLTPRITKFVTDHVDPTAKQNAWVERR